MVASTSLWHTDTFRRISYTSTRDQKDSWGYCKFVLRARHIKRSTWRIRTWG
jgi:hypothetical protein